MGGLSDPPDSTIPWPVQCSADHFIHRDKSTSAFTPMRVLQRLEVFSSFPPSRVFTQIKNRAIHREPSCGPK